MDTWRGRSGKTLEVDPCGKFAERLSFHEAHIFLLENHLEGASRQYLCIVLAADYLVPKAMWEEVDLSSNPDVTLAEHKAEVLFN